LLGLTQEKKECWKIPLVKDEPHGRKSTLRDFIITTTGGSLYDLRPQRNGSRDENLTSFSFQGDIIKLKIGLKENFRVIEAIVANVDGQRIGIRFEVDPVMRDFIQEVMNHYNKNKYSPKRRFAVE
jgi:hypothetical protein